MASACSVAATSEPKLIGSELLRTPAVGNCVLVTVALVCSCFLVVCGVLIVREYSLASGFAETRCRLRNISYSPTPVSCMFCAGLRDKSKDKAAAAPACVPSYFPCVQLTVNYHMPLDEIGAEAIARGVRSGSTANGGDEDPLGLSQHFKLKQAVMHPDSLQATGPYNKILFLRPLWTNGLNSQASRCSDAITHLALGVFGNSSQIIQIAPCDRFQAVPNGYLDNLNAQIAVFECNPFGHKCSFSVCLRNREESQRAVEQYVEEWHSKKNSWFPCFYDTESHNTVIVMKMYSASDVVHSMLWPSLVVLACGVIFLRLEMRRRRLTLCGRRASVDGRLNPDSANVVLVTRPSHGLPYMGTAGGGSEMTSSGRGLSPSSFGEGVGRKLNAVSRVGHPAVVYQSLPSLVLLPTSDDDKTGNKPGGFETRLLPLDVDAAAHLIENGNGRRGYHREVLPAYHALSSSAAVAARHHQHHQHQQQQPQQQQQQQQQQLNQSTYSHQFLQHQHQYKREPPHLRQTSARKLSASMDCFDANVMSTLTAALATGSESSPNIDNVVSSGNANIADFDGAGTSGSLPNDLKSAPSEERRLSSSLNGSNRRNLD